MAIYHLAAKAVSRSAGRSATAAAAYRAAECIEDERTGRQHDYTRKRGVEYTEIVVPDGQPGPDRATLWNLAETAERRKDACVAREIEIALPSEITTEQRHALAVGFARTLATERGCAVDVCIHAPSKDGDERNHHAHLLMSTRTVRRLESGAIVLGAKCEQERAGRDRKADLAAIRERWAAMCNAALQYAGHEARVDHRTLKAQGIDREPTQHMGPTATALERRGEKSRKRQDWEAEASERLSAAREVREQERGAAALDRAILDTSADLAQARAARDHRQASQSAAVIARGLSPAARRAVIQHGVRVMDLPDGTHWLTVHAGDGTARGIARGGADQRHLAARVAAALPAAVRQAESQRSDEQAKREQTTDDPRLNNRSRAQEDTGAERDPGQRESRREAPPTPAELDAAREALTEYAARHRITLDMPAAISLATKGLRDEWVAAGTGTQRQYMALRQVRREAERAARGRLRRTRRDGTTAPPESRDSISGMRPLRRGYWSAELAAARACGLHYEWDSEARVRRYRDRQGREVFLAERHRIEMLEHDSTAEHAALKIASAKWGGKVQIQGCAEFRERAARLAAREGIRVIDSDLADILRDEQERMRRGEPPRAQPAAERDLRADELARAQSVTQQLIRDMVNGGDFACSEAEWARACRDDVDVVRAECRRWTAAALEAGWTVDAEALAVAGLDGSAAPPERRTSQDLGR